ncbi:MAG: hypothetical protein R2883_00695 [Caldisericia bacterium]
MVLQPKFQAEFQVRMLMLGRHLDVDFSGTSLMLATISRPPISLPAYILLTG